MELVQSAVQAMRASMSIVPKAEHYLNNQRDWLVNPELARSEVHRNSMEWQEMESRCGFCHPDQEVKGPRLDQKGLVGIWQNSDPHPNARQVGESSYELVRPGEHYLLIPQSKAGVRHPLHFAELSLATLTDLLSLAAKAAGDGNAVFFMRFGEKEPSTATQGHLHAQVKVLDGTPSNRMITGCSVNHPFDWDQVIGLDIQSSKDSRSLSWVLSHWEGGIRTDPNVERWYCFEQPSKEDRLLSHLLRANGDQESLGVQLFQMLTYAMLISPLAYGKEPVPGGIVIIRSNHLDGRLEAHCLQLKHGQSYILNL